MNHMNDALLISTSQALYNCNVW